MILTKKITNRESGVIPTKKIRKIESKVIPTPLKALNQES